MTTITDDDAHLVARARGGDFAAFEALVARYSGRIYALALRIVRQREDAEEVVQQTFLTVIERIDTFREESAFATWLTRVATNHALALLRRRRVRATLPLAEDSRDDRYEDVPRPAFIAAWKQTPEEIASQRETARILAEALDELDEKYRLVFLLRDVEGLSTAETAEALGISESNTKVRLLRARLMLRERLTQVFGDETRRLEPHDHEHE